MKKKEVKSFGFKGCGLLILLSLVLVLITLSFSTAVFQWEFLKRQVMSLPLVAINALPIFLCLILLYLITNRLWLSFGLNGLIFMIMSIANKNKITYRDDPLRAFDVTYISESFDMLNNYELVISPLMIASIVCIVIITLWLWRRADFRIKRPGLRIFGLAGLIALVSVITPKIYFNESIYNKMGDKEIINRWSESQNFQSKGLVYPFIYSLTQISDPMPENYDPEMAKATLAQYREGSIDADKKVHMVSIMLEAYTDLSKYDGVNLKKDVYRNFHKLQRESISGNLMTDIFGGGTIQTEFAYLVGSNIEAQYRKQTNSNVWYFNRQGYYTEGMHPSYGWFYNRRNIYENFGFDNFEYFENKYENFYPDIMTDIEFFPFIWDGFERAKKQGHPYFHYSTTYQNHGPYDGSVLLDEIIYNFDDYDQTTYNTVNNYLEGIGRTDLAIEKMVDYFRNEEEPVVLVLFGDHKPFLGENMKGFEMLGINVDVNTVEGFRNYYSTPYLIWANESAKEVLGEDFIGKGPEMSPIYLMPYVMEKMNYPGNAYIEFLKEKREILPVVHHNLYSYRGDYVKDLPEEGKKTLEEIENVMYYYIDHFIYED